MFKYILSEEILKGNNNSCSLTWSEEQFQDLNPFEGVSLNDFIRFNQNTYSQDPIEIRKRLNSTMQTDSEVFKMKQDGNIININFVNQVPIIIIKGSLPIDMPEQADSKGSFKSAVGIMLPTQKSLQSKFVLEHEMAHAIQLFLISKDMFKLPRKEMDIDFSGLIPKVNGYNDIPINQVFFKMRMELYAYLKCNPNHYTECNLNQRVVRITNLTPTELEQKLPIQHYTDVIKLLEFTSALYSAAQASSNKKGLDFFLNQLAIAEDFFEFKELIKSKLPRIFNSINWTY
jgi:hypothetical protein